MREISVEEFHAELRVQGVSSPRHSALVCPICGQVQSMELLAREGCPEDKVERQIGFSCVGRHNGAGAAKDGRPAGDKPGCDWSLGGLFTLHELTVVTPDGEKHPCFEVASPEDAKALETRLAAK